MWPHRISLRWSAPSPSFSPNCRLRLHRHGIADQITKAAQSVKCFRLRPNPAPTRTISASARVSMAALVLSPRLQAITKYPPRWRRIFKATADHPPNQISAGVDPQRRALTRLHRATGSRHPCRPAPWPQATRPTSPALVGPVRTPTGTVGDGLNDLGGAVVRAELESLGETDHSLSRVQGQRLPAGGPFPRA